ncbi:MAG TPA: phosphoesterase PA-phosphatase, partial [Chitinophagaceae bacterium]
MKKYCWIALAGILLVSCKRRSNDYQKVFSDPVLYCKTVKQLNDVVLENNFPPMIGSRNYAYANIAAYECIAAGDNRFQSLAGQLNKLPEMPKPDTADGKQVDFHLAALLAFTKVGNAVTFPEGSLMGYYDVLKHMADSVGMPSDILNNTVTFSDSIVSTVMAWSKKDNYAQTRSAEKFAVTDEEGRWVPTPPMYAQAVEPHWKEMRCLVMDSCGEFMPPRPPQYNMKDSNSAFCKAAVEVMKVGDSLTEDQKYIADFW